MTLSKGKKFSAAEKHFQKREAELRKELNYWRGKAIEQSGVIEDLEDKLSAAQYTVAQQADWIDRLLQYTELDKKDIAAACKKDQNIAACMELLLRVRNFI